MQGLILAAGMGKRLKELTSNNTKCMVKVDGVALIDRMLHQLERCHLSRIIVVIGYEGKKLADYIGTLDIQTPVCFINNPVYDKTNNIYSLALAKEYLLREDTLLLESDLIFEDSVLCAVMEDPRETLVLADKYESWMDGTCIKIGEDDSIEEFIPGSKFVFNDIGQYYKTVNIYKFSKHFSETQYIPFLDAYLKALGCNEYYEQVLRVIATLDNPGIKAKKLEGQLWYEIDDIQDLDIASSMFTQDPGKKVANIQKRYGGYWRYPALLDFCYLVNPYFPPKKLMDEIKASFETLVRQYPSGMEVNSLLAAKNFGIHKEHIVVGNGAAELIKCLMEKLKGKTGFIRPTFEEYPNRYEKNNSVIYIPQNENLSYNTDDIMDYFGNTNIKTLLLINPDNPSGNYIKKDDVIRLAKWCSNRGICIIVDESFADFADEENNSMINEENLNDYPNMVVIKSISKSYGVPGIRLGILASANERLIAMLKKELSIWNINSLGEFYMQIGEKYKEDYVASLKKIKAERKKFTENLSKIPGLRIIPSQANYIMVELINGMEAKELVKLLLLEYNLFIKDLSKKIQTGDSRQFVRIAVRNSEDNNKLVTALEKVLQ